MRFGLGDPGLEGETSHSGLWERDTKNSRQDQCSQGREGGCAGAGMSLRGEIPSFPGWCFWDTQMHPIHWLGVWECIPFPGMGYVDSSLLIWEMGMHPFS